MLNFNDVANTKMEDVKAVPLPPIGTYRWQIMKLASIREFQGGDGTPYQSVEFPIRVVAPGDDVDVSSYEGKIEDYRDRLSFMYNRQDEAAFIAFQNQLKKFFVTVLGCVDEKASLSEGINASVNQQFLAPITWAPDKKDPEIIRAQVGRAAPLA